MDFALLNTIASWVGWMPVALVLLIAIILGIWFYKEMLNLSNERIDGLKEDFQRSEKDLEDCRNFTPDVVAERLITRHKLAQEALVEVNRENKDKLLEIENLKIDIENTRREAKSYFDLLELAQLTLGNLITPRDGQLNHIIINDIFNKIKDKACLYIPIRVYPDFSEIDLINTKNRNPYRIDVINPGMSQQYLFVFDEENHQIGEIKNEYLHAYDRDYHLVLLRFLQLSDANVFTFFQDGGGEVTLSVKMFYSKFHVLSPLDDEVFYIQVPMDKDISKLSFDELFSKLSEGKIFL